MNRRALLPIFILALWLGAPFRSPAPLIYTPGEGWHYETPGGEGKWQRRRAKDQLEVAQAAFDQKDFALAAKAARRVVSTWPFSDYAPKAQYLLGRSYEELRQDERAFKAYQRLIERYPRLDNYDEVVRRQKIIADRFLNGQWFKVFNYVPLFPSMDKTIQMYEQILKNGPYNEVAGQTQLNIGQAHENRMVKDYAAAAKAYERAADRYAGQPEGVEGLYRLALAYNKQARTAEYDQNVAAQAIATFTDFSVLHPDDARVAEAQKIIASLRTEQARGAFEIARYYERHNRWQGAVIYYNDVLNKDPESKYAQEARARIAAINKRLER
ncbi:MAG TPA: outer membrane protein assembly factor BamD [Methylomirabilota bacterium]|nr:outer membrane protein assembly factor BamD [Methylomirabilota bacterium]